MNKRDFLRLAGLTAATSWAQPAAAATIAERVANDLAEDPRLPSMTENVAPITTEERLARIRKAQALMRDEGLSAIVVEAGSALVYFTGIHWWRSERFTGAVIPAEGELFVVTPFFEAPSIRESLAVDADVVTWHEHEDPFAAVVAQLAKQGLRKGRIGIEASVRQFVSAGIAKVGKRFKLVSADAVTQGCRMYKSDAEIALMQRANDVTLRAYRHVYSRIKLGMSSGQISQMMMQAMGQLGARPIFALVLLNEASAFPHGSDQPQVVEEGSTILMDCGCSVEDYQADISRTWVFGEPSKLQRRVWNTVKRGQELALETAQLGVAAGVVDDVVRAYYEREGYGPQYALPGLSHRLGHGIGIDGHESVNFVRGEKTPLAEGMCFSNEPGIYLPGSFGVRLEDCLYMSADGPILFTPLSRSIDEPFA